MSISSDDDINDWKEAIEKEKLPGIHLLSSRNNNNFLKEYALSGIPRYILLDPDLKIIDYSAPRPSEEKNLSKLFKESGIE